jgi:peptide-methionine (S)-S-oxide reductase
VLVVFDRKHTSYEDLLELFWESHDPTQGMRQRNDIGTQYRSAIYVYNDEQRKLAETSRKSYRQSLSAADHGEITIEIASVPEFYYAEDYHQQYLAMPFRVENVPSSAVVTSGMPRMQIRALAAY